MFELNGKYNGAKVFTDNVDNETISQITNLLNQESMKDSQIRIMPDTHAGAGCVIGTTMTLKDKVIPNLVGVDIGCLDKDTEILTPNGWIRISEYNNEEILLYNTNKNTAFFALPNAFIKNPCDNFYHFSNSKNLDQMLSDEHHMLVYQGTKSRGFKKNDYSAKEFAAKITKLAKADNYTTKTTFIIENRGLDYSDNDIRIFIMISADGRIKSLKNGKTYIELHFRKSRKIQKAESLLLAGNIAYNKSTYTDGSICISFSSEKFNTKNLLQFYNASKHQLEVICNEVFNWDGTVDIKRNHKMYSTTEKQNADVIQFAFNATGIRAGIHIQTYPNNLNWKTTYQVIPTKNEYVSYKTDMVKIVPSEDGFKYCFNTSTGAFVIRRNNCISVTGNCGMLTVKLEEKNIDFKVLDDVIRKYVPCGGSVHSEPKVFKTQIDVEYLHCYGKPNANIRCMLAYQSVGTLGGGNHFIEVDKDSEDNLWLVIHTGSRHLGLEICNYYQNIGYQRLKDEATGFYASDKNAKMKRDALIANLKAGGQQKLIPEKLAALNDKIKEAKEKANISIPFELAYVTGQDFEDYIHDMEMVQKHAVCNRAEIARVIMRYADFHEVERFETIHNYIDTKNMILRKGSVSAQKGEKLLIPINMRDGSLICIGKGNPDWNYSAPHGAGRLMSRSKAKENLALSDFKATMEEAGIYSTSVNKSTIDEAPMAYKPMDEIIANIEPTVDIIEIIKPIYNFKASELEKELELDKETDDNLDLE